jgi:hypothetical protein
MKMGELESRRIYAGQREGMSSVPPPKAGGWISMRVCIKSKSPAFHAACGFFLAGLFLITHCLRAAQIGVISDPNGQSVYVNANGSASGPQRFESRQLLTGPANIDSIIDRISTRYQVDPRLVHAMVRVESNYDPSAVSSKGAMGLMQLIPATARRFGVQHPFDPRENIQGGVSYLRYLLHLFGGNLPLSLAAYNAGEQTVIRSGGIPDIPETEHYVRAITRLYNSKNVSLGPVDAPAEEKIPPIVRYVDSEGVVHFTNAE